MNPVDEQRVKIDKFVKACDNILIIKASLSGTTPQVKGKYSNLDELYLSQFFSDNVKRLPMYTEIPTMRPSLVYWYVKKYKRTLIFDPFVLGGERLIGAIVSNCGYLGINSYYPMQQCYKRIIETYDSTDTAKVIYSPNYQDIFKDTEGINMVFTHIPSWENACMVVSFLWKYSKDNMLIVLHFDEDNSEHIKDIERLSKILPGKNMTLENPKTLIYQNEYILILKRSDFFNLGKSIQAAIVSKNKDRLVYTLKESPMILCLDLYLELLGKTKNYVYNSVGYDNYALELAMKLNNKLEVYNADNIGDYIYNAIVNTGATMYSEPAALSSKNLISTTDPVFVSCLYNIIDETLPSDGPTRVWIELDNPSYLDCLMIKWPTTVFIICSRNKSVDLSVTNASGPSKQGRVIVYRMMGKETLQNYIDAYSQSDDAIIKIAKKGK